MTFNSRLMVYGVEEESQEKFFLHSFLDEKSSVAYVKSHDKSFPGRFYKYLIINHSTGEEIECQIT